MQPIVSAAYKILLPQTNRAKNCFLHSVASKATGSLTAHQGETLCQIVEIL